MNVMNVMNVFLAIAMFVCAALIDFAYARQTIATTNGRAFVAANWRALSYSLGCFGWLVAIKVGMWLLPFELAGLYLGTLVGVGKTGGQLGQTADVPQAPWQVLRSVWACSCRSRRQPRPESPKRRSSMRLTKSWQENTSP